MNIKLKASLVFEKDGEKYCITEGNDELKCKDKGDVTKKCRCGIELETSSRIVGGAEVNPINKYPWLVYIQVDSSSCGGTLVASKYVISAAHCFIAFGTDLARMEDIEILLGDHNVEESGETFLKEKKIGVVNLHHHPEYVKDELSSPWDITVVELAESVDLNVYTPACLAKTIDTNKFLGEKVTVAGWGLLTTPNSPEDVPPDVPYEVQVPVTKCEHYDNQPTPSVILCAQEKGKDSCFGDSGGPMTYKQANRQHVLIGVVHKGFDESCGMGGYYVQISEARKWIESQMSNPIFCPDGADAG